VIESLPRQASLRRIVSEGIEPVLVSAGFERVRKSTWARHRSELVHVVALLSRRESYTVQWGVVSAGAVEFLWGRLPEKVDVGDSVMAGTPGTIRHPAACEFFQLGPENDEARIESVIASIPNDMRVVEARLREFDTRRQLRSYLMENRNPKDGRDFVIPAQLPLKLYTAAVLAAIDRDPDAVSLAEEAETALQPWIRAELTRERIRRLKSAVADIGV
jgi:hypothetical protein